jgi:hypothetical protein
VEARRQLEVARGKLPYMGAVTVRHWLSLIAGAVCLLVALFLVLPVAVNLPVSWPGGVLLIILGSGGTLLIRRSLRGFRSTQE